MVHRPGAVGLAHGRRKRPQIIRSLKASASVVATIDGIANLSVIHNSQ
jgi:hypothetical protein